MNKSIWFVPLLLVTASLTGGIIRAATQTTSSQTAADATTTAVVKAANDFLAGLSADQQAAVKFAFSATKAAAVSFTSASNGMKFTGEQFGSAVWSNFPTSDVPRPGLKLGALSAAQRTAALNLVKAALSISGYQKIIDIMGADQALSETGTPYDDGNAFYVIGLFGTPSLTTPWMLQYGGHHLALNIVVAGGDISIAPTLTGDQPASYQRGTQTVRPLGQENDLAFKLINALDASQRTSATLKYQITDLVLGPGQDGKILQPEGINASSLTATQQALLLELVGQWVGLMKTDDAAPKLERIKADLSSTYFAWYGATTNPSPVYFRITGPTVQIEFAHQGGSSNHIHTVYRDPTNAYGAALTK